MPGEAVLRNNMTRNQARTESYRVHSSMNNSGVLVFVPTYNERDNVERICLEILALGLSVDILFLDDSSPDGTGDIIDRLAAGHTNVFAIHRAGKLGIGSAHLDGISWAYDNCYTTLVTMDCDFTHRPEDVPRLLKQAQDADVVVGSRYLAEDSLHSWSFFRRALTSLGHLLTRAFLRMKYDATGGFRVYRLDRIPRELFGLLDSTSYSFFFESLYAIHVNGHGIKEIPIDLPSRTYGHSKMRVSDAFGSLARLVIVAAGQLFVSRYKLPKPAASDSVNPVGRSKEIQAWDDYWQKPKSPLFFIYGGIAALYRKYLIKRNLNRLIGEHFPPGSKLLHAGCGSGQVDSDLTATYSVTALDMSAPALKIYERLHNDSHHLVRGTIFSVPIKDDSVDGIYHLGVMEHFDETEIQQILKEFHRVLKPGGKMAVFWPPKFGLSVRVLSLAHFVLNRVLRRSVKLHPDEITLLRSKTHVDGLFEKALFTVDNYYFGIRDFFTYCMVVVSKRPQNVAIEQADGSAQLTASDSPAIAD